MLPTIQEISVNEKRTAEEGFRYFSLGVHSTIAAAFINKALLWLAKNCRMKHDYYFDYLAHRTRRREDFWTTSNLIGGGFLIKIDPTVSKDLRGEVGIKTGMQLRPYTIRQLNTKTDITYYIYDKIANLLKNFWRESARDANESEEKFKVVLQVNGADPHSNIIGEVHYPEYKVLYELLKRGDVTKIKVKYGMDAFDAMVGQPVENQIVIDAVDVIEKEMQETISKWQADLAAVNEKCRAEILLIEQKYNNIRDDLAKAKEEKIAELTTQLTSIKKQMIAQ